MSRTVTLNNTVGSKSVHVTPNGIKIGVKGRVIPPGAFFGKLDKSTARKFRKEIRNYNPSFAAEPRQTA